jgi:hypothetical protein
MIKRRGVLDSINPIVESLESFVYFESEGSFFGRDHGCLGHKSQQVHFKIEYFQIDKDLHDKTMALKTT